MNLSKKEILAFQTKILSWYACNKRDLPWRTIPFDTSLQQRDPYKILVSEIMSQQTQISRVVPKYEAWMRRFPTVESLALAPTRDVLLYWSGLGYNSRALRLQKTAKILHELGSKKYEVRSRSSFGYWPRKYEELITLPGIGKYTANALLCFAFNEQIAVIDTNVKKVIVTQFQISNFKSQIFNEKEIEEIATVLLPEKKLIRLHSGLVIPATAYDWNQALMDYASEVLKKEKIVLPKQTPFKSSNRYYRGYIMKELVMKHTVTLDTVLEYFRLHNPIENEKLIGIIEQLKKDGLVNFENDEISIV